MQLIQLHKWPYFLQHSEQLYEFLQVAVLFQQARQLF